ncbi:copper-translocating P-type ATPase, partial [Methylobacterium sp. IIF4SW-B5]|nr:copper-translocating P-type ATPase [Methylobacterium ajmalii]
GLAPVLAVLAVGARARRLMMENLWLAGAYNLVAVPLAAAGLLTPLIAALAMSGSSVVVTLNALRARGRPRPAPSLPSGESGPAPAIPAVLVP